MRGRRRWGTVWLVLLAAVVVAGTARADLHQELFSQGVVAGADGIPVVVRPGTPIPPGGADAPRADLPVPARYADLAADALRDLDLMVLDGGAKDGQVLAGIHGAWRYSWTRDAAWVAAALAVSGRQQDGLRVLTALQRNEQERVGAGLQGWQARYLPDGSARTPDQRGAQLDGPGWALWATSVWAASETDPQARQAGLEQLRPLVVSAARTARDCIDPATGLPRPSMDYWELPTTVTTLGLAAPVLAGLRAGGPLLDDLGLTADVTATRSAATVLDAAVQRTFGAKGYPRSVRGGPKDTSVTWLTPPFAPARGSVLRARDQAWTGAARAVGGVAPGVGWRENTVAWTPSTSAFALSFAASGDRREAEAVLDWLDKHRTTMGSLPEKVGGDGQAASVAPLSWTAAAVLLTLHELYGAGVPRP
jgi:GH15 family glucan-1,4-alpha-glucosidase